MTEEQKERPITKERVEQEMKGIESREQKVGFLLEKLDKILFGEKIPHFKTFWEVSALFLAEVNRAKADIAPQQKKEWLDQFSNLSNEAKRLRDERDHESAFNVEQFEGACLTLEKEWEGKKEALAEVEWPIEAIACQKESKEFLALQGRLLILQAIFIRVNSLRKELATCDMRIRTKNALFDRLSKLSDEIFPERKEKMDLLSSKFQEAVQQFVKEETEKRKLPFFEIKQEIKALQALAKWFVLNAPVFRDTRLMLSGLWDKLKEEENRFKQAKEAERQELKANFDDLQKTIEQLKKEVDSESLSKEPALKRMHEIQQTMRKRELAKNDVAILKSALQGVREKYDAEERKQEAEARAQAEKRDKERKEREAELHSVIQKLLESAHSMMVEEIIAEQGRLKAQIDGLTKPERMVFENALRPLREIIARKKEESYNLLPEEERNQAATQQKFLMERKQARQEVTSEIRALEKAAERCGMDLQKALEIGEQLAREKERFREIDLSIQDLEKKIQLSKTA